MAHRFGMTPYELLREDADQTIYLFNAIVETTAEKEETPKAEDEQKPKRVYVTEETATGHWY